MSRSSHRIRRLRWAVTTDVAATAFGLRQQLRQRWETDLLPILNTVFDQAADGHVLHLSKLELHVQATADDLWDTLQEQIYEQTQEQLAESLSDPTATKLIADNPTGAVMWTQSALNPVIAEQNTAERFSPKQKWLERFLHYIHTGSVPWDIVDLPAADIAAELQQVWQQQRSAVLQHLNQSSLASSPLEASVYFRLMQLAPAIDRPELVQTLMAQTHAQWRTALTTLLNAWLAFKQPSEHLRLSLTATILAISLDPNLDSKLPDLSAIATTHPNSTILLPLLQTFLPLLPGAVTSVLGLDPEQSLNISAPLQEITADQSNKATVGDSPDASEHPQELATDQGEPAQPSDQVTGSDTRITVLDSASQTIQTALNPSIPENNLDLEAYVSPPLPELTDELPLKVPHAGLVLLHGFIPHFFEATGIELTDERQIVSECLPRAAALLHHLATGSRSIYEYELALIKLLLGLEPQDDLVVADGLVNEGDCNEALELLQSAIGYWSVLKNTAPNTLRSTFLQRYGLLYPGEQGWHLRVEGQAFDMLLNYLPWNISLIKLPWMLRPLYTEWPLP